MAIIKLKCVTNPSTEIIVNTKPNNRKMSKSIFKIPALFIIVLLAYTNLNAQKAMKRTIATACDCINSVDKSLNSQAFDQAGNKCFTDAILENFSDLAKENDMEVTSFAQDGPEAQQLGERIGLKMVEECPHFLPYIALLKEKQREEGSSSKAEEGSEYEEIEGTLTAFVTKDVNYPYLAVETEDGSTVELTLLHFAEGTEEFIKKSKAFIGKKVVAVHKRVQLYNHERQWFEPYQELQEINFLD